VDYEQTAFLICNNVANKKGGPTFTPDSPGASRLHILFRMRKSIILTSGLGALVAGLSLTGCKTELEQVVNLGYLPPFSLPDSLALPYGQQVQLTLPAEYQGRADVRLALSFRDNPRLKLTATDSLTALLARAITVDQASRRISIDARRLYPTSTFSSSSGVRTPRTYQATLTATSSSGFQPVKSHFTVRVLPAQLNIVELNTADKIPYGYGIYDNKPLAYTVDYAGLDSTGTALDLHVNGRPDGQVALAGRRVVVAPGAGDPAQQAEWIYDLLPNLSLDGYRVAYRQFRVVLMPKPKFFFGTYYSSYDLTVLQNRVVIQLGSAYTSAAPTFYPEKYKGSFTLKSVEKDGLPFADSRQVFSVDAASGKVSVAPNTVLAAGSYKLTLQTQATTGLPLETALTLVMEQ
jgi:hypothetical protein